MRSIKIEISSTQTSRYGQISCMITSLWLGRPKSINAARAAIYFRHQFTITGALAKVTLEFSAIGAVEPWINGKPVSGDFFTPGWSDFRKRAYLCRYDVTELLAEGKNCLGLILADGWAGAPFGFPKFSLVLAPRTMVGAKLQIEYSDESTATVETSDAWQWRSGPIVHHSIYNGETYDARKELISWTDPAAAKRGWKPAETVPPPKITLTNKKCPPVRVTEEVAPKTLRKEGASGWLIDYGQNLVGVLRVKLRNTKRGQRITLRFAEMLQADGSLYVENLRGAKATDVYICRGGSEEEYTPRFTFHGFRYATVHGLNTPPQETDLTALVLHNDLVPTGKFSCSQPMINRLQSCIRWGQRGNFLEAPTDCPQRDERLGWSGDAQVFVDTACFNYDCEGFYRQWMDAMRDGQRTDGAFPDVAPDICNWHGNAGWGDAGVIVPHAVWQHYGSTTILEENWNAMQRHMKFLLNQANALIQPDTVYGDWLAVDAVRPHLSPTPTDMIGTAYHARDAKMMATMARALGKSKAAKKYSHLAQKITAAFVARFVTSDGLVLGDTQTSYLIALGFDLLPKTDVNAAQSRLLEKLAQHEWHLSTGFLGTPLLNPVLTQLGRSDVAYKLLLTDTFPSWLYPITNGATTMWERWNSWTKEEGFGPVDMNSFNHYAYGAIGEWLYQSVAGIAPDPEYPGYARAIIAPHPDPRMKRAKASLKTRAGSYHSQWKLGKTEFELKITIPKEAQATVPLPTGTWKKVRLNDKPIAKKLNAPRGKPRGIIPYQIPFGLSERLANPVASHGECARHVFKSSSHAQPTLQLGAGSYTITIPAKFIL